MGIIPADAGSTGFGLTWIGHAEDHPRGCGEHNPETVKIPMVIGIIPADAGSTLHTPERAKHAEDHPRGCGEHQPG